MDLNKLKKVGDIKNDKQFCVEYAKELMEVTERYCNEMIKLYDLYREQKGEV